MSSPIRSSATLRSANTASAATGCQASSGMTCGTSAGAQPFFAAQHPHDPVAVAGSQRQNRLHFGVERRRCRRIGVRWRLRRRPASAARSRTGSRRACAASASGWSRPRCPTDRARRRGSAGSLERVDVAAVQPAGGEHRRRRTRHRQRQDRREYSPPAATSSADADQCRRRPRRRAGRTPRR